jgi:type III secretion protein L
MKFFNLINEGAIHPASSKVIPNQDFSKLLDADQLLEEAKENIKKYKETVDKECEELKEAKKKEGFEEGLDQWSKKVAECETLLQAAKQDLEKLIIPVAISAAKKIVAREIETHPDVIIDIIKQSLKSVSQHKRFTIYVNKHNLAIVDENRVKLKETLESVETLTVMPRENIKLTDAIIETEAGIINVEQEQLWKSLETAFANLIN